MRRATKTLLGVLLMLASAGGHAHDARPVLIEVAEQPDGMVDVDWKVPGTVARRDLPSPVMPSTCESRSEPLLRQQPAGPYLARQRFACAETLTGAQLEIRFPGINPALTTMFRVRTADGIQHTGILKPGDTQWTVPGGDSAASVAGQYTLLGISHIWAGIDHLLFVACLLFIARTPRQLVITITGFTVAHSITLAAAVLDVVRIAVPPVEAVIALSVVFLAAEIARNDKASLTWRYPALVSSAFGLLHGFGFAAVLREIGLPPNETPTALLFFNVGVEIGQLLFVALLLSLWWVAVKVLRQPPERLRSPVLAVPASYVIGGVAAWWLLERVAGFWA